MRSRSPAVPAGNGSIVHYATKSEILPDRGPLAIANGEGAGGEASARLRKEKFSRWRSIYLLQCEKGGHARSDFAEPSEIGQYGTA
jgi:hypothetical protein